jgi:putative restriction endonuclease
MYWWVNHKQTHKQEIEGGYIWSPKKNANSSKNNSYDNMEKTSVGDVVFSFADAKIKAIGRVIDHCTTASKPTDFGDKGDNWDDEGWLVKVEWSMLTNPFRAKDNIALLLPYLSDKYAPIQSNGNGNQGCYLASISTELAEVLFNLSNVDIEQYVGSVIDDAWQEEELITREIEQDTSINQTTKKQLVDSRRGQGKYRRNLALFERQCRVTGITDKRFLIASHSKPWSKSENDEKLDGNNGFFFSPHVDKLYDNGWLTFESNGDAIYADNTITKALKQWGIKLPINIGKLNDEQQAYLAYHREYVFKQQTT